MKRKWKDIVKSIRKQRKLNQYELAEMLDVSVDAIRRWEYGSKPSDKNQEQILKLYKENE